MNRTREGIWPHTILARILQLKQRRKSLRSHFKDIVPKAYHHFRSVFAKESFEWTPPKKTMGSCNRTQRWFLNHHAGKIYNLTLDEQKQLEVFLNENLKSSRICPSKSPMAAPFFFIKKKSWELCPVQDYHRLNAMTIKNSYPFRSFWSYR